MNDATTTADLEAVVMPIPQEMTIVELMSKVVELLNNSAVLAIKTYQTPKGTVSHATYRESLEQCKFWHVAYVTELAERARRAEAGAPS